MDMHSLNFKKPVKGWDLERALIKAAKDMGLATDKKEIFTQKESEEGQSQRGYLISVLKLNRNGLTLAKITYFTGENMQEISLIACEPVDVKPCDIELDMYAKKVQSHLRQKVYASSIII